jgi:hypothetical protein
MYSGETLKRFSKHKRQLRDSIIQWSVYKYCLLINTELNAFVQQQIDRTDDKFVQWKVRRLLLLGLRARGISSRRDDSNIFFVNSPIKHLKSHHTKYTDLDGEGKKLLETTGFVPFFLSFCTINI